MADNRLDGLNPLAYMGVAPQSVSQLVFYRFDPTSNDWQNFKIGAVWINTLADSAWILLDLSSNVATWVRYASTGGTLNQLTGDTGTALPTGGSIQIAGGNNIGTVASGSVVTVNLDNAITLGNLANLTINNALLASSGFITTTNGDFISGSTSVSSGSSQFNFRKSRSGAVISTGDSLGVISYQGFDGTNYIESAQIRATSTGTIGASRIGSYMDFYTHPDSVVAATARMRIASMGAITIFSPDSNGLPLTIANSPGAANTGAASLCCGSGDPSGVVTASQGSLYLRLDGSSTSTRAYINTNGTTGWTAVTTAT